MLFHGRMYTKIYTLTLMKMLVQQLATGFLKPLSFCLRLISWSGVELGHRPISAHLPLPLIHLRHLDEVERGITDLVALKQLHGRGLWSRDPSFAWIMIRLVLPFLHFATALPMIFRDLSWIPGLIFCGHFMVSWRGKRVRRPCLIRVLHPAELMFPITIHNCCWTVVAHLENELFIFCWLHWIILF